jgi:hypothetical protein
MIIEIVFNLKMITMQNIKIYIKVLFSQKEFKKINLKDNKLFKVH